MKVIGLFILALGFYVHAFCMEDEGHFEHLTIREGLSSNDITALLQDHFGFLWIGTSNGLNRYDGQEVQRYFHSYQDSNSVVGDHILHLAEINEKYIFIATSQGLSIFNLLTNSFQNSIIQLPGQNSLRGQNVTNIFQDKRKQIYISFDNLFSVFDSSFRFLYSITDLPNSDWLRAVMDRNIQEDKQGRLWILTYNGLVLFDPASREIFNRQHNPDHWKIFDVDCAFYGLSLDQADPWIYFSCWNKPLFKFSLPANQIVDDNIEDTVFKISYQSITGILLREGSNIWCGSEIGLYRIDPINRSLTAFSHTDSNPFSLSSNGIRDLITDRDHNLWIGTDDGLNRLSLKGSPFHSYSFTVAEDSHIKPMLSGVVKWGSILWVSTWNDGLKKQNIDSSWSKVLVDPANPPSQVIWNIFKGSNGNLWLATEGGLYVSDDSVNGTFHTPKYYPDSLTHQKTIMTFEDSHHDVWVSLHGTLGLLQYKSSQKRWFLYRNSFPLPFALPAKQFASVAEATDGNLWFGNHFYNNAGIAGWNRNAQQFKSYGLKNNISENALGEPVNALFVDRNNILWIGSVDYGLVRFTISSGEYKVYTHDNGLPDNEVDAIVGDRNGFLWLATSNGIARFDPRTEKSTNFGFSYGVPIQKFNSQCFYDSVQNEVYFTTVSDVICFNPDEVREDQSSSPAMITGIRSGGESISPFNSNTPEINYSRNALNFTFTAINFRDGRSTQYAYRLDGYDKDWNYYGNTRSASYDNLSPGHYTFRVKAANGAGLWNEEVAAFPFIINPPFYDRWYFIVICILGAVAILYLIYRIRISKLIAMEQLRSRISRDLHDEVGSTLSSITMLSRLAQTKMNGEKNSLDSLITRIEEGSQRMTQNMQDIVWAVNPSNDSMQIIIARMRSFAMQALDVKNIQLHFEADKSLSEDKLGLEERQDLYLIFKEGINNAVKYSDAGNILIQILKNGRHYEMKIKDDGNGFDLSKVSQGNGLANMRVRARRMRAELKIDSAPGRGTVIDLIF